MKKGQIAEGTVIRSDFPAKGVMRPDDPDMPGEVAVKNALPGQRVRVRITKARKGKCEGQLLEVLSAAPGEIVPDCPHYGRCGGCCYRTLPYAEQLKLKEDQVKRILAQVCDDPHFEGIKASPAENSYRNKMEFSFGDAKKDGPLCLGMHCRGSFYDIVTVDECRIVDEDFRKILKAVLELSQRLGLPYYHRVSHEGYLRHLLVRKAAATGEILVDLITTRAWEGSQSIADEQVFLQMFTQTILDLNLSGTITGILHTYNDALADVITDEGTECLYGRDFFAELLLGMTFRVSPFSFFQTNSAGTEVLYETVRTYIGDVCGKRVFDLYSGTGTIAQILSPACERVTGVEIVPEAVEAARVNAQLNGLTNCSFIAGDVLKVLDTLDEQPDLIILDPPRDGIHPKALPRIISYGVEHIVYVSCKPTSLARDLVTLQHAGYRVERSCCIDMFPATANVETVCLLSNTQRPKKESYITLDVEMEDYYRIKNEGKNSTT